MNTIVELCSLFIGGEPATFSPGTGPIFIRNLNCPSGIPVDAYVECLNEARLGQSECSHDDDIGVRCTGLYTIFCTY